VALCELVSLSHTKLSEDVRQGRLLILYYGGYSELNDLGVIGWAFTNIDVAQRAMKNAIEKDRFFTIWQRDKHVVVLWRDKGTTDQCMQQMAAILEDGVESGDKKDNRSDD